MFYLPDTLDNHYATALKMQKWQTIGQGLPSKSYSVFFAAFFRSGCPVASGGDNTGYFGTGALSDHFQDRFQGIPPENIIGHLIYVRRNGIKADSRTRHFDHADVVLPISDCHRICQADAKTV